MSPLLRAASLALGFALAAVGCATAGDCGPDWYAVGERDGRIGTFPQADLYAGRCKVPVDAAAYQSGYRDGYSQRPTLGGM